MTKKILFCVLILSVMISYNAMADVTDSNQVIIRLVSSGIITFPPGKSEAMINEVEFSSPSLRYLLIATGAGKVALFVTDVLVRDIKGKVTDEASVTNKRQQLKDENKMQLICDYIAGMTDRFALQEYKKLFDPFERV